MSSIVRPPGRPADIQLPFRLLDIDTSGNCTMAPPNVAVQEARSILLVLARCFVSDRFYEASI